MKYSFWLSVIIVVAGGLGIADAQTSDNLLESLPALKSSNETPDQMRLAVTQYLPEMAVGVQNLQRQLTQARKAGDVVKTLCLNDKLNQADVTLQASKDRKEVLLAAIDYGDLVVVQHEFSVLQVFHDRMIAILKEANQCIGEELDFVEGLTVRISVEKGAPVDPTAPQDGIVNISPIISPPSILSPTR
jgi:hypothetical protein